MVHILNLIMKPYSESFNLPAIFFLNSVLKGGAAFEGSHSTVSSEAACRIGRLTAFLKKLALHVELF